MVSQATSEESESKKKVMSDFVKPVFLLYVMCMIEIMKAVTITEKVTRVIHTRGFCIVGKRERNLIF